MSQRQPHDPNQHGSADPHKAYRRPESGEVRRPRERGKDASFARDGMSKQELLEAARDSLHSLPASRRVRVGKGRDGEDRSVPSPDAAEAGSPSRLARPSRTAASVSSEQKPRKRSFFRSSPFAASRPEGSERARAEGEPSSPPFEKSGERSAVREKRLFLSAKAEKCAKRDQAEASAASAAKRSRHRKIEASDLQEVSVPVGGLLASRARRREQQAEELGILVDHARDALAHRHVSEKQLRQITRSLRKRVKGQPTRPVSSQNLFSSIGGTILSFVKPLLLIMILLIVFLGSVGVGALIGNISMTDELPASLLRSRGGDQNSFVYDSTGRKIATLTGFQNINREWIALSQVQNTAIVDAFISIEDERFRSNIGISPRRIASAVLSALTNGGEARHGGSTISQQTVKLLTGEDQRSVQRKIQEWYRAIALNNQLTKSEIMELYLNLVPMANSYVGIQSAAKAYFGKNAGDLSLAECAYLAGIPKSPSTYDPLSERGRRNGLRRQRQVLANMYRLGKIDAASYRAALSQDLVFKKSEDSGSSNDVNSYFVEYAIRRVRQDLINKLGYSELAASRMVGGGGLRIHLTLDPNAQKILDDVYADHANFEAVQGMYDNQPERPNSGSVLIDNDTHAIIAMQGGVGAKTQNLVLNRATDIKRQPGSAIKPVGVYGPAVDLGVAAGNTVFQDVPKALDPERPDVIWPQNYARTFSGNVLMRFALKESLNTVAVQTLSAIGVENAKAYLSNNGWDMKDDFSQLSLAVGAMTHGISPLEMANSYATFAANGVYHEPIVYTRVEDADGNILLDQPSETFQVFKPSTAFAMGSMLQEVTRGVLSNSPHWGTAADYGSVRNAQGVSIPTSVKTGTTEDAVDQWTSGFTPYYTYSVWYGFDNRVKTTYIPEVDSYKVVQVFYRVMNALHQNKEARSFEMPPDTVAVDVSAYSGLLASQGTYNSGHAYTEYFAADSPLIPQSYDYSAPPKREEKPTETKTEAETKPNP